MSSKNIQRTQKRLVAKAPKRKTPIRKKATAAEKPTRESHITAHVSHLLSGIRDAFNMEYRPSDQPDLVKRLMDTLPSHVPVETFFKWFYGNSLAWITSRHDDVVEGPMGMKTWQEAIKVLPSNVRRFMRNLFRTHIRFGADGTSGSRKRKALSVGQTLLMMKKGTPVVADELIAITETKHKTAMRSRAGRAWRKAPRTCESKSWADQVEEELDFQLLEKCDKDVKFALKQLIPQVFKRNGYRTWQEEKADDICPFPSFSAHVGSSRQKLGAVGEIAELFHESVSTGNTLCPRPLVAMSYHPLLGELTLREFWDSEALDKEKFWSSILTEEKAVEPVYLREPLKVRTITKGPSKTYWMLRNAQQYLWGQLKVHKNFQLVGRPLTGETLEQVFGQDVCVGEEFFESGDYSAATDNLRRIIIKWCWKYLSSYVGMNPIERDIGFDALCNHVVHYKDEVIQQENGSLMGSPLSFIVLCLCNAATIMCGSGETDLRKINFLVNGDDCVMRWDSERSERWRYYARHIGMEPSPGKCYRSKDWLQMNSDLYLAGGGFKRIPFLNFSLASPSIAKGGEARHWTSYGNCARSFVKGFEKKREKLLNIYIRRMKKHMDLNCPKGISWGLPEHLGGLGLPYYESEIAKSVTSQQLCLARHAYDLAIQGKGVTISQPQDLPRWVKSCMQEVGRFTRTVPRYEVAPEANLALRNRTELDQAMGSSQQLFSLFLWNKLLAGNGRVPTAGHGEDNTIGKWQRLSRKSLAQKGRQHDYSLHELLNLKGFDTEEVGGVKESLRVAMCYPRRRFLIA